MTNVTSANQVLIDFGTSSGDSSGATYRVKVSNGNGVFRQIKFGTAQLFNAAELVIPIWQMFGSADKILEVEQWGDISWISMNSAFTNCLSLQLTATDSPNLNAVTDVSFMFLELRNLQELLLCKTGIRPKLRTSALCFPVLQALLLFLTSSIHLL